VQEDAELLGNGVMLTELVTVEFGAEPVLAAEPATTPPAMDMAVEDTAVLTLAVTTALLGLPDELMVPPLDLIDFHVPSLPLS